MCLTHWKTLTTGRSNNAKIIYKNKRHGRIDVLFPDPSHCGPICGSLHLLSMPLQSLISACGPVYLHTQVDSAGCFATEQQRQNQPVVPIHHCKNGLLFEIVNAEKLPNPIQLLYHNRQCLRSFCPRGAKSAPFPR